MKKLLRPVWNIHSSAHKNDLYWPLIIAPNIFSRMYIHFARTKWMKKLFERPSTMNWRKETFSIKNPSHNNMLCKKKPVYAWKNRDETICYSLTPDWTIKCLFIALIIPNQIGFVSFSVLSLNVSIFCYIKRKLYVAIDALVFISIFIFISMKAKKKNYVDTFHFPFARLMFTFSEHKIFAFEWAATIKEIHTKVMKNKGHVFESLLKRFIC